LQQERKQKIAKLGIMIYEQELKKFKNKVDKATFAFFAIVMGFDKASKDKGT
jgi:hypothetical protein